MDRVAKQHWTAQNDCLRVLIHRQCICAVLLVKQQQIATDSAVSWNSQTDWIAHTLHSRTVMMYVLKRMRCRGLNVDSCTPRYSSCKTVNWQVHKATPTLSEILGWVYLSKSTGDLLGMVFYSRENFVTKLISIFCCSGWYFSLFLCMSTSDVFLVAFGVIFRCRRYLLVLGMPKGAFNVQIEAKGWVGKWVIIYCI